MQNVFVFTGIEDEGFEMLEHLAYLYLANNKVSHTHPVVTSRFVFSFILLSVVKQPEGASCQRRSLWL